MHSCNSTHVHLWQKLPNHSGKVKECCFCDVAVTGSNPQGKDSCECIITFMNAAAVIRWVNRILCDFERAFFLQIKTCMVYLYASCRWTQFISQPREPVCDINVHVLCRRYKCYIHCIWWSRAPDCTLDWAKFKWDTYLSGTLCTMVNDMSTRATAGWFWLFQKIPLIRTLLWGFGVGFTHIGDVCLDWFSRMEISSLRVHFNLAVITVNLSKSAQAYMCLTKSASHGVIALLLRQSWWSGSDIMHV